MGAYWLVAALAALPCLGIVVGAATAELSKISRPTLGTALHFAEGAMLAVVGVELMPRALGVEPPWLLVVAFLVGGGTFIAIEKLVQWAQKRRSSRRGRDAGPWMIYVGAVVDYLTDGIMIGTGVTIATQLGLVLALGQAVANAPLAFVAMAALKGASTRRARGLMTALFVGVLLAGAALGYGALRGLPEEARLAVLAFGSGVLVLVIVEEITPRADRQGGARHGAFSVLAGFAVFALAALYLG